MMKSSYVMEMLRLRRGMEGDDESHDEQLQDFPPMKALEECCAWKFGYSDWASWLVDVAEGCGFTVVAQPLGSMGPHWPERGPK